MKKLILKVILLISLNITGQNYSYFENDVRFINKEDGAPIKTLTHFGFFPITEKFGFTDYASIEGNNEYQYGQVLLGGYYNITNKLSMYLLAGKESISNQIRFGYMIYFTTGDKIRMYAFYQRNQNPFADKTKDSQWYDIMLRFAISSKENRSFYMGGRYMRFYGIGSPISFRKKITTENNIYISYTTFYDINNDFYGGNWIPTLTLALEFL